ncbi:serine hydroxymethyltransferase, partial [Pseudomonas aeruginosa]
DKQMMNIRMVKPGHTANTADPALVTAHITQNKNPVPNYPQSPFVTTGISIGTPAVTTLGIREGECLELSCSICDNLNYIDNPD